MIDVNGKLEVFIQNKWREAHRVFDTEIDSMPIVVVDVPGYFRNYFFYPGDGSLAGYFMGDRVSITFIPGDDSCDIKIRNAIKEYKYEVRIDNEWHVHHVSAINLTEARNKMLQELKDKCWWNVKLYGATE